MVRIFFLRWLSGALDALRKDANTLQQSNQSDNFISILIARRRVRKEKNGLMDWHGLNKCPILCTETWRRLKKIDTHTLSGLAGDKRHHRSAAHPTKMFDVVNSLISIWLLSFYSARCDFSRLVLGLFSLLIYNLHSTTNTLLYMSRAEGSSSEDRPYVPSGEKSSDDVTMCSGSQVTVL